MYIRCHIVPLEQRISTTCLSTWRLVFSGLPDKLISIERHEIGFHVQGAHQWIRTCSLSLVTVIPTRLQHIYDMLSAFSWTIHSESWKQTSRGSLPCSWQFKSREQEQVVAFFPCTSGNVPKLRFRELTCNPGFVHRFKRKYSQRCICNSLLLGTHTTSLTKHSVLFSKILRGSSFGPSLNWRTALRRFERAIIAASIYAISEWCWLFLFTVHVEVFQEATHSGTRYSGHQAETTKVFNRCETVQRCSSFPFQASWQRSDDGRDVMEEIMSTRWMGG